MMTLRLRRCVGLFVCLSLLVSACSPDKSSKAGNKVSSKANEFARNTKIDKDSVEKIAHHAPSAVNNNNVHPVGFWNREIGKVGGFSVTPTRLAIGTVAVLGTVAVVGGGVWWWSKRSAEQKELTALRKTAEEKAVEVVRYIGNDVIRKMNNGEISNTNKVAVEATIRDAEERAKNGVAPTLEMMTKKMVNLVSKVVEKLKASEELDMSSLDGLVGEAAVRAATSLMTKVNDAWYDVLDGLVPLTAQMEKVELEENMLRAVKAKMDALKVAAVRSSMMKLKATVKSDGEREILRRMALKVAKADRGERIKLEKVRSVNTRKALVEAAMGTGPAIRALVEAMCEKTVATVSEATRLKSLDDMTPEKLKVLSWLPAEHEERLRTNDEFKVVRWMEWETAKARVDVLKILAEMKVLTEAETKVAEAKGAEAKGARTRARWAREALKEKAERVAEERVPELELPEYYTQPETTDYWTNATPAIKTVGQNYVRKEAETFKAKLKNMLGAEKWENKNDAPTEVALDKAIEAWMLRRRRTEVIERMTVVDAMRDVKIIAGWW